jgi:outer membrane lipoprotein SlyB
LDWDHEVIRLETFHEKVSMRFDQVTRIERENGSRGNFGPGAALGGIAGGVLFTVIVAATSKQELGYVPSGDIGTAFMLGAVAGIAVGGLLGATVFRTTVWQEVPAPRGER